MDKLFAGINQHESTLIPGMEDNFQSYFCARQWLKERTGHDHELS
jgi:hypothetical protein